MNAGAERAGVAVVGAGAAGLMAGIWAARRAAGRFPVTVFDSRAKIGAKILISGGTRCNVTNRSVKPSDYRGGPAHFVKHVLEAFTPGQTRAFFSEIGVELVLEPTGKYFPTTNSGRTVLDALTRELSRAGARLVSGVKIETAKRSPQGFRLNGEEWEASRLVLASGGLSYPETGSDGTGFRIAESLGHSLEPRFPALTPFLTSEKSWTDLAGVTLDAELSLYTDGKKSASAKGSFLFTHGGFSGPSALDLSRYFAASPVSSKPAVEADFLPEIKEEALTQVLREARDRRPERPLGALFVELVPARLAQALLARAGVDGERAIARVPAKDVAKAVREFKRCPLSVTGVIGYKKAEATAGGVKLSEVDRASMASKKTQGLYFAGEILDVDGRIGGFNFQWAWSTGYLAGNAAAKSFSS